MSPGRGIEADDELRAALVATTRAMCAARLNTGTAGNASVRTSRGMLITPSGLAPDACTADDMVVVDAGGRADGRLAPSSEWRLHHDLYANRPEAGAIIHAHAPFATALACQRLEIPPFHFFHTETPAPDIPGGIKGVGEAGTIAGVSLVASAVDDALSDLGVTVTRFPITPPRLLELIRAAQARTPEATT